jgi:hypothetical protein
VNHERRGWSRITVNVWFKIESIACATYASLLYTGIITDTRGDDDEVDAVATAGVVDETVVSLTVIAVAAIDAT